MKCFLPYQTLYKLIIFNFVQTKYQRLIHPKSNIKLISSILFCSLLNIYFLSAQTVISWNDLADVQFRKEYIEEFGAEYDMPIFGKEVQALDGQEIQISGYMLPLDGTGMQIVLSKFPFTSCYFCGNAGPETVIELWLKPEFMRRYAMDSRLVFKGKLRLNTNDFLRLSYILVDAEEV